MQSPNGFWFLFEKVGLLEDMNVHIIRKTSQGLRLWLGVATYHPKPLGQSSLLFSWLTCTKKINCMEIYIAYATHLGPSRYFTPLWGKVVDPLRKSSHYHFVLAYIRRKWQIISPYIAFPTNCWAHLNHWQRTMDASEQILGLTSFEEPSHICF